jgi:hypothetical protein
VGAVEGKHKVMLLCPAGRASCAEGGHFVACIPCLGRSGFMGPRVARWCAI